MEDNKEMSSGDDDAQLESQALEVVKNVIPVVRIAKNATKALLRLSSVRSMRQLSSDGADFFTTALEAGASRFRLTKSRSSMCRATILMRTVETNSSGCSPYPR